MTDSGSVTITIEVGTNGATTLSPGMVRFLCIHRTCDSVMITTVCCLVVGLVLGLDLVSGWLVVMHRYLYYFRLSLSDYL